MNYLLGAHGTGKSTLIDRIKEINPNYPVMETMSRPLSKGLKEAGITVNDRQKQIIFNELTLDYHNNVHKLDEALSSRSLIDLILYNKFTSPDVDMSIYQQAWERDSHQIGKIFIIPIEFPLVADEVRNGMFADPGMQKEYEQDSLSFITNEVRHKRLSVEQIIYLTGTVEERIESLRSHLNF
jgi:hypothetical protein